MKIRMDDIQFVKKTGNNFKVSWKMTSWCNYRCPYCYMKEEVEKGNNHTPFEKVLEIASNIDKIINHQAKGRRVVLHLIGGEICYYDLIQVLERIKSPLLKGVIFATNFSNTLDYWQKLVMYCKSRGIKPNIIASFHLSQCDKDEFVEKAIKIGARVKCVVNSKNINEYRPYFERLRKAGNRIEVTVERDFINSCEQLSGKDLEYVNELNEEMKKNSTPYFEVTMKDGRVIPFGTNIEFINSIDVGGFDPEGFVCTAGLDGIRITQTGKLQRAGCRHASILNDVGNILDEYTLPTTPIICKTSEADSKGVWKHKMCTCFGNSSMWRKDDNP